ncbi:MAG: hypothetical protein Q4A76_03585 [Porphyromonadaceae bacterium]|nr:hypothetical protein [Porphyromonadaceae bacterium]
MDKNYRFDLSMFERFEREVEKGSKFKPHLMLKGKDGTSYLVKVSNNPDPARWTVIGNFFDVTFLSYQDLKDFIETRELEVWTEEDDRNFGSDLSNIHKKPFRVKL